MANLMNANKSLLKVMVNSPFFIFDVESVGLHGDAFAVAGGVYINGRAESEFLFTCPLLECSGTEESREWVLDNVPPMEATHLSPRGIRDAFWKEWEKANETYIEIHAAGECLWPVKASFMQACINDDHANRCWKGPYPFHEIASFMAAAGMDPLATYKRMESEKPAHNPLADVRLSARLLSTAINELIKK